MQFQFAQHLDVVLISAEHLEELIFMPLFEI
jgi:hypothetical protein